MDTCEEGCALDDAQELRAFAARAQGPESQF